jgi:hypothetical protein
MAADKTLVQGAAMAAPKFVDVAGAFNKNFESTLGDITKATNEADAKRNELINSLDFIKVDENGNTIPMSESQLAIAKQIRQDVLNDINSGDPFSPKRAESISKAKLSIQETASMANVHKEVLADMQSAKSELSSANDLDAIKLLNDIKDAKMEKDPKTGELKFNVGGVLKSAQELAAYPNNIIEKPTVPMATVNTTLAAATEKSKTVDPNDPSKYAYNVIHAMPLIKGSIQEQLNGPYGTDFRMHVLSTGDSMYIKSDNPIASKYQGKTKSGIEAIAVDQLIENGKITSATTKEQKDRLVTEFLNEEVTNAYVEGFTKMLPNSKLQPKPEKDTVYKPTPVQEEVRNTRPFIDDLTAFVKRVNPSKAAKKADPSIEKYKGDKKVKQIINKINSLNPESPTNLLTRGEAFKKYVELENERLKSLDADERKKEFQDGEDWLTDAEMKQGFLEAIGESPKTPGLYQIFDISEFQDGTAEIKPAPVNSRDSKSVLNFMLDRVKMTDKARNVFKSELVAKNFK